MKNTNSKTNLSAEEAYRIVAEAFEMSAGMIKQVRLQMRADRHNIHEALALVDKHNEMSRAQLIKKLKALKSKKHSLNQQAA